MFTADSLETTPLCLNFYGQLVSDMACWDYEAYVIRRGGFLGAWPGFEGGRLIGFSHQRIRN